jgi:hypothetical protein
MRLFSSAQSRALAAIGGFGVLAALVTGLTWQNIETQDQALGRGYATAGDLQNLTFRLADNIRGQESAVSAYVVTANVAALSRYRQSAAGELALTTELRGNAVALPDVITAIDLVTDATARWQTGIAEPAIEAV